VSLSLFSHCQPGPACRRPVSRPRSALLSLLSLVPWSHLSAPLSPPSFLLPRAPLGPEIPGDLLSPGPARQGSPAALQKETPEPQDPNPSPASLRRPPAPPPPFFLRSGHLGLTVVRPLRRAPGHHNPRNRSASSSRTSPSRQLSRERLLRRESSRACASVMASATSIARRRWLSLPLNPLGIFLGPA
jgi:hypothetical protein